MVTVYALEFVPTGEAYVGCTECKLGKRMREHRCALRQQRHTATKLQELWNQNGDSQLRMVALESLPDGSSVEVKREREMHWLRVYEARGKLLNAHLISFRPSDAAIAAGQPVATATEGRKHSPEANLKRSLSQLGIPKGHGAKISATKQAKKLQRLVMR